MCYFETYWWKAECPYCFRLSRVGQNGIYLKGCIHSVGWSADGPTVGPETQVHFEFQPYVARVNVAGTSIPQQANHK